MRYRYTRYDGGDPLGGGLDPTELLEEMSEELLEGGGVDWALERLVRRGARGLSGTDQLLARLRARRQDLIARLDLEGPLRDVARALDDIVLTERKELARRLDDEARAKELFLDALPRRPAPALRELQSYRFASPEAASAFEELMERLRREVLDSYFKGLAGGLKSLTDQDLTRVKDMLAELNQLIAARAAGRPYDFDGFMDRYADMFPGNPKSLDELLEQMARRMAALSRLLASLDPDQRARLAELAAAILDDLDLAFQVDQLANSLRALHPDLGWDEGAEGSGGSVAPMSAVVDTLEELGRYEELEHALEGAYPGASLEDVDEQALRRALDDDAVIDLKRLKQIEQLLEEAGLVQRRGGRLELSARGARLIGERALTRLLERIRKEPSHRARGGLAEPTGATRPWAFGDEEPLSVERTVYNAVLRAGPGRVQLVPEDFEVVETETRPRTATALLLDLSFSMPLRGHWVPAKRMALALHALIEGKYPQDSLYIIGFSDYARRLQPAELAQAGWDRVHGTNMEHAFMLGRRLLGEDPRPIKQALMVTDGEPTAHLEGDHAEFNWPPIRRTIDKTLRAALRLARQGIALHVYMLDESPGLINFMQRLARLTGGSVEAVPSARIEGAVIDAQLRRRRRAS